VIAPCLSLLLDLTRLALSLTVVIGHWTQPFFQDSWPNLTDYALVAVGGFFVLSGFTIRMIYPNREHFYFRAYVIERWSRILSVTIPALLLTVTLDAISRRVNPEYYLAHWSTSLDHPVLRVLINLVGVSQVWGQDISPQSNSPFWSISYELAFYLVYGLWLSGRRWLSVGSLILLGPQITLMLPLWLLGVVAYDVCYGKLAMPWSRRDIALAVAFVGAVLSAAGLAAYLVAHFGHQLRVAFRGVGWAEPQRVQISVAVGAMIFFALLVPVALISNRLNLRLSIKLKATARWLGNLTFTIYLFHFPMLVFLGALQLYDRNSPTQKIVAVLIVLALIALATPATTRLRALLRDVMSRAIGTTVGAESRWMPAKSPAVVRP
jgi:peptidoglycan/LPS O-acetylase OafA/YrhL